MCSAHNLYKRNSYESKQPQCNQNQKTRTISVLKIESRGSGDDRYLIGLEG